MAESTLSITFDELQREVGHFLGWGRTPANWTNTQNQDFEDILKRGLRQFYFPPMPEGQPFYEWSFLRKASTIVLVDGTGEYDLPDDFGGTILDQAVTYEEDDGERRLHKVPEHIIRANRVMESETGFPKYYAVRNKAHTPTVGQRWEMMVYPTPNATAGGNNLAFRYVFVPNTTTTTNKYPVGGAQYSEVILASVLAAAAYKTDDEPQGEFQQKFESMLMTALRNDVQQKQNDRGGDS